MTQVYSGGECLLIEYGNNEILGSCRTEFVNSHQIRSAALCFPSCLALFAGARLDDRVAVFACVSCVLPASRCGVCSTRNSGSVVLPVSELFTRLRVWCSLRLNEARNKKEGNVKKIAYLLDAQTIRVQDLNSQIAEATIAHGVCQSRLAVAVLCPLPWCCASVLPLHVCPDACPP